MLLILGLRHLTSIPLMCTRACRRCGRATVHTCRGTEAKITIFFIPLPPRMRRYYATCTSCGTTRSLNSKDVQDATAAPTPHSHNTAGLRSH
jgi:hypothetical protein